MFLESKRLRSDPDRIQTQAVNAHCFQLLVEWRRKTPMKVHIHTKRSHPFDSQQLGQTSRQWDQCLRLPQAMYQPVTALERASVRADRRSVELYSGVPMDPNVPGRTLMIEA
jgi:hypothetical protein